MTREPTFDFHSEDEKARIARRVDAMAPAAPDGKSFEEQVLRLALELYPVGTSFLPSDLRRTAEQLGLSPHHPNRWGVVAAKLKAHGFVRTTEEATSRTTTRNQARENVWRRTA